MDKNQKPEKVQKPKEKKEPEAKKPEKTKVPEKTEEAGETVLEITVAGQKEGWKTALGALVVVTTSLLCLYIIGFSDSQTSILASFIFSLAMIGNVLCDIIIFKDKNDSIIPGLVVYTFVGALFGVLSGGIIGSIKEVLILLTLCLLGGIACGTIFLVSWDKTKKKTSFWPAFLLGCVFALILMIGVTPISKYHNQNQLKRDKKIVEILQITVQEEGIEILLPSEYVSENNYLKKVFSVWWYNEEPVWKWREVLIPCREGNRYWYKTKLPFPKKETDTEQLILFFKHAYENYQASIDCLWEGSKLVLP